MPSQHPSLVRLPSDSDPEPMAKLRPIASVHRTRRDAVAVARVAGRQCGAISRAQLTASGLSDATISRWVAGGRLHRVHPGVYAAGHVALGSEGKLIAALLYAGPGSALSHVTAAWWWELLGPEPATIHVSALRKRRSLPGLCAHRPRKVDRVFHRGLPVTDVALALVEAAPSLPFNILRRAVAEAEYRRLCDAAGFAIALRRGRLGSAALRRAVTQHYPELARTLSVLEERFLALCERSGVPMPEVNVKVGGLMVDALWRDARLIVELDGHAAHGTRAAIERDRRRELTLRSRGYTVLRYTWAQVIRDADLVVADLTAALHPGR
jgi:hypothetical protein